MTKKSKHPLRFGFHRPAPDADHMAFKLSGVNLYLLICGLLLLIGIGSLALVRYTPFVAWVGSNAAADDESLRRVKNKLNQLQGRIDDQSQYIKTLQLKLSGEDIEFPTAMDTVADDSSKGELTVERIPLDDTFRRRVQRSNINIPVRSPLILDIADERNLEDEYLVPPISGVVSKSFAPIDRHFGVDILAPENSAVKSILDGLVIESDWTLEGGNSIIIQHAHNLISVYKHNSALLKKKGDRIKTGEAIAIIGDTGLHSDGPHVHFELWYNGDPVDPEAYISLSRN